MSNGQRFCLAHAPGGGRSPTAEVGGDRPLPIHHPPNLPPGSLSLGWEEAGLQVPRKQRASEWEHKEKGAERLPFFSRWTTLETLCSNFTHVSRGWLLPLVHTWTARWDFVWKPPT